MSQGIALTTTNWILFGTMRHCCEIYYGTNIINQVTDYSRSLSKMAVTLWQNIICVLEVRDGPRVAFREGPHQSLQRQWNSWNQGGLLEVLCHWVIMESMQHLWLQWWRHTEKLFFTRVLFCKKNEDNARINALGTTKSALSCSYSTILLHKCLRSSCLAAVCQ